jgi:hypothetical protein
MEYCWDTVESCLPPAVILEELRVLDGERDVGQAVGFDHAGGLF